MTIFSIGISKIDDLEDYDWNKLELIRVLADSMIPQSIMSVLFVF